MTGRPGFVRQGHLPHVNVLFTDAALPPSIAAVATDVGTDVVIASTEAEPRQVPSHDHRAVGEASGWPSCRDSSP